MNREHARMPSPKFMLSLLILNIGNMEWGCGPELRENPENGAKKRRLILQSSASKNPGSTLRYFCHHHFLAELCQRPLCINSGASAPGATQNP